MRENGQGVPKNYKKALSWSRMAAAQEYPGAQEIVTELEAVHLTAGMASKQFANCGALRAPGGVALMPCARRKLLSITEMNAKQSKERFSWRQGALHVARSRSC